MKITLKSARNTVDKLKKFYNWCKDEKAFRQPVKNEFS